MLLMLESVDQKLAAWLNEGRHILKQLVQAWRLVIFGLLRVSFLLADILREERLSDNTLVLLRLPHEREAHLPDEMRTTLDKPVHDLGQTGGLQAIAQCNHKRFELFGARVLLGDLVLRPSVTEILDEVADLCGIGTNLDGEQRDHCTQNVHEIRSRSDIVINGFARLLVQEGVDTERFCPLNF